MDISAGSLVHRLSSIALRPVIGSPQDKAGHLPARPRPRGTANRGLLVRIAEQTVSQDLGDLSPGSGGIWSECVVGVARHDLGGVGRLDVVEGPVGGAYVAEGSGLGRVHDPLAGHDNHLGHLGAGYVLVRAERAVVIA